MNKVDNKIKNIDKANNSGTNIVNVANEAEIETD